MYTVLICDDDQAILESLEIYLHLEGYEVVKATNGEEALAAAMQISVSAERVMQAQKHITTHEGRFLPNQVFTTIPPI